MKGKNRNSFGLIIRLIQNLNRVKSILFAATFWRKKDTADKF